MKFPNFINICLINFIVVNKRNFYKIKSNFLVKTIKMSKLSIVQKALETNTEAIIVNTQEGNYSSGKIGFFCNTVDYWIAPKKGLYEAEKLQKFMIGLIPNLKPDQQDNFRQDNKRGYLELGKLYFDEKIGKEKTNVERIFHVNGKDKENFNLPESVNGKQTIKKNVNEDYKRRIWVRLFPDEAFAKDILNGKLIDSVYRVKSSDLKKYKPGLIQRLIGKR